MASISKDKKGKTVTFIDNEGHRRYLRLGQVNQHT